MCIVYYHYINGYNSPGAHSKLIERDKAWGWIRWMEKNMKGFVFDFIEK